MISPRHREPNGRHQRHKTRDARAEAERLKAIGPVLKQPHRRRIPRGDRDNPYAGFALGRLRLADQLSPEQFGAGERYTRLAVRHMRDVTGTLPRLPSAAADEIAGGLPCLADMDDDAIFALRREWGDAMRALADTWEQQACVSALASVCIMDRDPTHDQLGSLRLGLNALERLWREP